MKINKFCIVFVGTAFLMGCSSGPEPIEYPTGRVERTVINPGSISLYQIANENSGKSDNIETEHLAY